MIVMCCCCCYYCCCWCRFCNDKWLWSWRRWGVFFTVLAWPLHWPRCPQVTAWRSSRTLRLCLTCSLLSCGQFSSSSCSSLWGWTVRSVHLRLPRLLSFLVLCVLLCLSRWSLLWTPSELTSRDFFSRQIKRERERERERENESSQARPKKKTKHTVMLSGLMLNFHWLWHRSEWAWVALLPCLCLTHISEEVLLLCIHNRGVGKGLTCETSFTSATFPGACGVRWYSAG